MPRSASRAATAPLPSSVELRVSVAHAQSMRGPTGMDTTDAFLGGAASSGRLGSTSGAEQRMSHAA
jgi:hypothetical protein